MFILLNFTYFCFKKFQLKFNIQMRIFRSIIHIVIKLQINV